MSIKDYENETWDEWDNRDLGASEEHAVVSSTVNEETLNASLGMQTISLRMPSDLLVDLKLIAKLHGIGYQPLMKQIMQRFVICEMKQMLRDAADRKQVREGIIAEDPDFIPEPRAKVASK